MTQFKFRHEVTLPAVNGGNRVCVGDFLFGVELEHGGSLISGLYLIDDDGAVAECPHSFMIEMIDLFDYAEMWTRTKERPGFGIFSMGFFAPGKLADAARSAWEDAHPIANENAEHRLLQSELV